MTESLSELDRAIRHFNAKDGWRARNAVTQAVIQSMDGKSAYGEDM
jgi:hypothetical protein